LPSLCIIPFINLSPRPDGQVKICSDGIHSCLPDFINLNEQEVELFWNSPFMKQLRLDMIAGKKIPHCEWCNSVDANGGKSKRAHINKKYLKKYINVVRGAKENEGHLTSGPKTWEFRFSSVCNNACLTCSPTNSTLIEKQFRNNLDKIPDYDQYVLQGMDHQKYSTNQGLFDKEFWKYLPGIERLELHGGEPFYDPKSISILKQIVALGHSQNIELLVHSNMTNVTDEIIDLLNQFRLVYFRASIDGFGWENDHIRWPSKWNNVLENVDRLDKKLNSQFYRIISGTLSVYNCLSIDKVYQWIAEDFPTWQVDWHPAYLPKRFGVNMIDLNKRRATAERVDSIIGNMQNDTRKLWPKIKSSLLLNKNAPEKEIKDFVVYMKAMDKIRKQNTLKSFPHIQEVYDKYQQIIYTASTVKSQSTSTTE
jgi:hypothetical protein